jgi:hypothetical protein
MEWKGKRRRLAKATFSLSAICHHDVSCLFCTLSLLWAETLGTVRSAQTAFAEQHWLLTWVHKLTKNRRSLASLPPFVSVFALQPFSLKSLYNHFDSKKDRTDNIFMTMNWSYLKLPPFQWGQLFQESSQTGPDHLPDQDCMPTSHENNQTTADWDCVTIHAFVPCPHFFCLFKPIAHVCTPEDG